LHLYQEINREADQNAKNDLLMKHTKDIESKVGRGCVQKRLSTDPKYWQIHGEVTPKINQNEPLQEGPGSYKSPIPKSTDPKDGMQYTSFTHVQLQFKYKSTCLVLWVVSKQINEYLVIWVVSKQVNEYLVIRVVSKQVNEYLVIRVVSKQCNECLVL